MKRTQRKDAWKNIQKQKVSFLSIVVIAAMAVSAYLGLSFASRAIAKNADRFYDATNFRDAEIISTLLLSEDDLNALRETEGVSDVEAMWQTTGAIFKGAEMKAATVRSTTERINTPLLLSGRLPASENECVVDWEIAGALSIEVGDEVLIRDAQYLRGEDFTVCGIAKNSEFAVNENNVYGDRIVLVRASAFDLAALNGCCMKALLRYTDCDGLGRFDEKYITASTEMTNRIETFSVSLADRRTDTIRSAYSERIAEGEQDLDDAKKELDDARRQLDDGWNELKNGEEEADKAKLQLDDAKQQLEDAKKLLADGEAQLSDGAAQLQNAKLALDDSLVQLTAGQSALDDAKRQLEDGRKQLDDGWAEYRENEAKLAESKQQLDDGKEQLDDGQRQLDEAKAELDEAKKQLDDGEEELAQAGKELEKAKKELEDGADQLNEAGAQLISGWEQLEDAKALVRDAISSVLAPYIENYVVWSARRGPVKPESVNVSASEFPITDSPAITADLNLSLEQNLIMLLVQNGIDKREARELVEMSGYEAYEASYQQLAAGAREWDAGHREYLDGYHSLYVGETEYLNARAQYDAARKELDEGWKTYSEGLAQYEAGLAEFAEKKAPYEVGLTQYSDGAARLAEGLETLNQGEADYASALAEYEAAKEKLDAGWAEYDSGLKQYEAARAAYAEKTAEYDEGLEEYETGLAEYEAGTRKYEDGRKALADGRTELEDGEDRYAKGMADYLTGAETLDGARIALGELDECRWVVLDNNGNASFQIIKAAVRNISDLAIAFASIFILVAALVIYATLGRIVEEQRRLVGATRALGFYKNEILAKYLVFGVGATLAGMLMGVAIAYFLVQPILTSGYGQFFNFENTGKAFMPWTTLAVLTGGILLAVLAVCFACVDLLRSTATSLMQEKVPACRKNGGGRAKGHSLYTRLILMNIRTDLKRVAVTVVSVAGCCALLVTGFTMRNGIMGSVDAHFKRVLQYDYALFFSGDSGDTAFSTAQSALEHAGASSIAVRSSNQMYMADGELSINDYVCGDLTELQPFVTRADLKTGRPLPSEPDGVWICRKVSETTGLRAGDSITLYDNNMHPYTAPVAGIFENYINREMLMSRESYEHIFGMPPEDNALLVLKGNMQADELEKLLASLEGVESVRSNAAEKTNLEALCSPLNLVAVLMVGIAAIMACFIILNLINIHVTQKKRELTIMRVNGFTVREVIAYIAREAVVTNLIGIVLGLGAGMLLSYKILCLLEGLTARFIRSPQPVALLLAVLITAGFSIILNMIALRKVKYLKLTDVT